MKPSEEQQDIGEGGGEEQILAILRCQAFQKQQKEPKEAAVYRMEKNKDWNQKRKSCDSKWCQKGT